MMHTRKATTGAIVEENSHPFDIGGIIGAHNGMIMNHHDLEKKYNRSCEVDSEHLFHHINEGLSFEDISGYGAIEYIRKEEPKKIYLSKMKSGELSIKGIGTSTKDCRGVIWSSDRDHLEKAVAAAQIPTFSYKVETGIIYYVSKGNLFLADGRHDLAERNNYSMPNWRDGYSSYQDYSETKYPSKKDESKEGDDFFNLWRMEQEELDRRLMDEDSLSDSEIEELIAKGVLPNTIQLNMTSSDEHHHNNVKNIR